MVYSPIFSSTRFPLLWGDLKSLILGFHIRKSVPCELFLLGYIILQMTRKKNWDPKRIKTATEATRNEEKSSYKASRVFSVPQTTPEPYVKDRQKSSSETVTTKLGRKQVLPCEAQNDLAEYCLLMERIFWGGLDNGRRHASRLPNCCKKRN